MKSNINQVMMHGPLLIHYHFSLPDEELIQPTIEYLDL